MAKFKKKNRLGTPPTIADAGDNLSAPETAPASPEAQKTKRPARKTGRTVQFGTRVRPEFLKDFKRVALENDLKLVELLEESLQAYKKCKKLES